MDANIAANTTINAINVTIDLHSNSVIIAVGVFHPATNKLDEESLISALSIGGALFAIH